VGTGNLPVRHYCSRNSQPDSPLDRTPYILYSHPPMNSALRRYAYFYGYYS
jgi:hypothetical protein